MNETRTLHFSVDGGFVNKMAREMAFMENPPRITKAIDFVMSCIETDQLSEGDRLLLAIKIIEGDADVVGVYPGDDYGVDVHDERVNAGKLAKKIDSLIDQIAELKDELRTLYDKFNLATEDLPDYKKRAINRTWRTELDGEDDIFPDVAPDTSTTVLKAVLGPNAPEDPVADMLERMHSDTTDDYGWLAPSGKFYPVEWGRHNTWPVEYIKEHPEQFGFENMDRKELRQKLFELRTDIKISDFMCAHGWLLLHNPSMGTAFIASRDYQKGLTKAQREFLYDYYTKRNKPELAKEFLETGD